MSRLNCGRLALLSDVPVCQSRHDLGFDIFLNFIPFLTFLGWAGWEKFSKVARGNVRNHAAFLDGIVIVYDCRVISQKSPGTWGDLLSSTAECAAARNSSEFIL